jgi:DNA modification methylase
MNQLFLGDSLELLKKIPKESVDMIFADPPYNLSLNQFHEFFRNHLFFSIS